MGKTVNLLKLSVGSTAIEDLAAWQATAHDRWADGQPRHVTRMWPRRAEEVLNGGSIYWVIGGLIQCRQRILSLDPVEGEDGITRCALRLDPKLHPTQVAPRRPFQGWRYLAVEDSPADLTAQRGSDTPLPPGLRRALADIGVV